MKIICVGLSKTGTKSMNAALTQLGYKVYDFFEHVELLKDGWDRIAAGEEPVPLLREMYADAEVGVAMPMWCCWEELAEAFPNAKVILTVRDTDDDYATSAVRQLQKNDDVGLLKYLSPTYSDWTRLIRVLASFTVCGTDDPHKSRGMSPRANPLLLRQQYRRHTAHVKQCCPEDRLLVFNCRKGWEPLCKFLGLPVPDEPFPHKNIKGAFTGDLTQSRTFRRAKQEVFAFSSLILAGVVAISYYCVRHVGNRF